MIRVDTPEDKKWRAIIKRRDRYKCKKCGQKKFKLLRVHHIKTYADNPHLRLDVDNGITLCKFCHDSMKGSEESFERLCRMLLANKKVLGALSEMLYKMKVEDEQGKLSDN